MFGLGNAKPVAEHEAEGEVERVYHEIRQVLRVTGVNLNFRTWAGYDKFLPAMWDAIRPNAETCAFEEAADRIRSEAARAAVALGRLEAASAARLGESQAYQIRAVLDLYHYINPKLLLLTAAVRLAFAGEPVGQEAGIASGIELLERGSPARMYPMEMESEEPDDQRLQDLFKDIKQTLSLPSINSDYRSLALWPDYLAAAWARLKPITQRSEYAEAADRLREMSRSLARALPYAVPLTREKVEELGADAAAVAKTTERFEALLPGLILNIALFEHDWHAGESLARSPFPASARHSRNGGGA